MEIVNDPYLGAVGENRIGMIDMTSSHGYEHTVA